MSHHNIISLHNTLITVDMNNNVKYIWTHLYFLYVVCYHSDLSQITFFFLSANDSPENKSYLHLNSYEPRLSLASSLWIHSASALPRNNAWILMGCCAWVYSVHWTTSNVGIKPATAEETTPSSPKDNDGEKWLKRASDHREGSVWHVCSEWHVALVLNARASVLTGQYVEPTDEWQRPESWQGIQLYGATAGRLGIHLYGSGQY